ncbi:MAG: right-handed parallel beta-helix repeat-containing protein [Chitinophagaceae bacterium]|nr:right-handed parallel beta-helix repeat-containing protein [Chitinophagaceae bacterium]
MKQIVFPILLSLFFTLPVTAQQGPANDIRAFYIGHSLSDGIPEMIRGLTQKERTVTFEYRYQKINGSPLRHQWNQWLNTTHKDYLDHVDKEMLKVFDPVVNNPELNIYSFFDKTYGLPTGQYTHLVLTESVPRYYAEGWGNIEDTYRYTDSFYRYAQQYNPDVKPYLYEVWHCINSGTPTGCPYDKDSKPFRQRLAADLPMWEEVVTRFNAKNPRQKMTLIPVGQAIGNLYDAIERKEVPGIHSIKELFTDDIHINDTLRYLSACVHYATLFERSPVGLTHEVNRLGGEPFVRLSKDLSLLLQKIAWETVQTYTAKSRKNIPSSKKTAILQQEIFVSPTGKDSNPGTIQKPLRSIQKAINLLGPGKTVTLLKGVYDLKTPVTISVKGDHTDWVTLRGAKGESVILDGINVNIPDSGKYPRNNGLIQIENAAYIRVQNIHVRNSRRAGINIQESKYIDVVNCISENSLSPGIAAWQRCEHIRVLGNTVINANNMNMSWTPYRGHEAPHEAISMAGPHYFEVAWNHVYNCQKEGIDVKETASFGIVHHNYIHDLKRQGLYIDGWFGQLEDIEMYENVVHGCESGIAISSEEGPNTKNLKIHHNLVYNNRATGIFFSRWGADNPRENVDIYNNTFYKNGWGHNFSGDPQYWLTGGCYLYSTNLKDIRISHNIFAHNFPFEIGHTARFGESWSIRKKIDISHNLIQDINTVVYPVYLHTWLKDSVFSMTGTHAILADPLFVDAQNGDFRLQQHSPALNTGYLKSNNEQNGSCNYMGAFPVGASKEKFWWSGKFPPEIDIENYRSAK